VVDHFRRANLNNDGFLPSATREEAADRQDNSSRIARGGDEAVFPLSGRAVLILGLISLRLLA